MDTTKDADTVLEALGLDPIQHYYTDHRADGFGGVSDYKPLLRSFGHEVEVQVDEADYQGSTLVLFVSRGEAYGVLCFGWGSCSGCDALQGCTSWAELEELRRRLMREIHWSENKQALAKWLWDDGIQHLKHYASERDLLTRFRTDVAHRLGLDPATGDFFSGACT